MLDETVFREMSTSIVELEAHKRFIDSEISNIRVKMDSHIVTTQEQFESLASTMSEIRDMARDNRNITIGFDGNNGLRGNLTSLIREVSEMTKDFEFLRQTAKGYVDMKSWFMRLLVTSLCAIAFQFFSNIWSINSQIMKQEALRVDVLKALSVIEKQREDPSQPKVANGGK